MPKRKRNQPRRRRRVPTAQQLAWSRNHAAQSRLRNAIIRYRKQQARTEEIKLQLRNLVADSYELGAAPEWIADAMGITPQAVRKSWLPPRPSPETEQ